MKKNIGSDWIQTWNLLVAKPEPKIQIHMKEIDIKYCEKATKFENQCQNQVDFFFQIFVIFPECMNFRLTDAILPRLFFSLPKPNFGHCAPLNNSLRGNHKRTLQVTNFFPL